MQLVKDLTPDNFIRRKKCCTFEAHLENDALAETLICGENNCQLIERPHMLYCALVYTVEHVRVSPKLNIFSAVSIRNVHGQFFLAGNIVTIFSYFDITYYN